MKVKDLLEIINNLPEEDLNLEVCHRGYESGYDPAWRQAGVYVVCKRLEQAWYEGTYDIVQEGEEREDYDTKNPVRVFII